MSFSPQPGPDDERDGNAHQPDGKPSRPESDLNTSCQVNLSTLRRAFAGHVEQTFQGELGVANIQIVDYLSDMLAGFLRTEALFGGRTLSGKRLHQVASMMDEAEQRIGIAKHESFRRIGDFTLFWAGFYPETLPKLMQAGTQDHLIDYVGQGKRSYWIASDIETEHGEQRSSVLHMLSDQFEMVAYGLHEVRRSFEGDATEGGGLLFCL